MAENGSESEIQTYFRLPAGLHRWLKETAAENRRSITSQVVVLLEEARERDQKVAV